jgi:hypothetical protein
VGDEGDVVEECDVDGAEELDGRAEEVDNGGGEELHGGAQEFDGGRGEYSRDPDDDDLWSDDDDNDENTVYQYTEKQRKSEYFPFLNYSDALMYLFDIAPPKIPRRKMDLLWLILQDPKFDRDELVQSVKVLRRQGESGLPRVPRQIVRVEQSINATSRPKTISVSYFSIIDYVKRAFADPVYRAALVFGEGDSDLNQDSVVKEFHQTPFSREPLKWSSLVSFYHDKIEYKVGDFMLVSGDENNVYRIESLFYEQQLWKSTKTDAALIPPLKIRCKLFPKWVLGIPREVYKTDKEAVIAASKVQKRVLVHAADTSGNVDEAVHMSDDDYLCRYYTNENEENRRYQPKHTVFSTPMKDEHGNVVAYVEVYCDEYSTDKGSWCGVYMRMCNVASRFRHCQEFIKTLMLVPRGVDLGSALVLLRKDIQKLEKGITTYDVHLDRNIFLSGAIGFLLGDLPMHYKYCRHLGNKATKNCRNCWNSKVDVARSDTDFRDHTMTRREAQTDIVILQIQQEIKDNGTPPSGHDAVRTKYGANVVQSLFGGLTLDHHTQSMWDIDHLLWLGIIQLILHFCWGTMKGKTKSRFIARYEQFPTFSNWTKPHVSFGKEKFSAKWSMTTWKEVALFCVKCFEGLLEVKIYHMFLKVYMFVVLLTSSTFKATDVPTIQALGQGIHKLLVDTLRDTKFSMSRPNGHGLLACLCRTLPAVVNLMLVNTSAFEHHHKFAKQLARGVNCRVAALVGMTQFNDRETMQVAIHGTKWGDKAEFQLGKGIRGLRDPRPDRSHLPHPLLEKITHFHKCGEQAALEVFGSAGKWMPRSIPRLGGRSGKLNSAKQLAAINLFFTDHIQTDYNINNLDIVIVPSVIDMSGHRRHVLKPGDHVEAVYEEIRTYAVIDAIVLCRNRIDSTSFLLCLPRWYELAHDTHKRRLTVLVHDRVNNEETTVFAAIPIASIVRQVVITHCCVLTGGGRFPDRFTVQEYLCTEVETCILHGYSLAKDETKCPHGCRIQSQFVWEHIHDYRNHIYEVLDDKQGFVPQSDQSFDQT